MDYRVERDSLGSKNVPINAYYGIQTLRASENFPITGITVHKELILALAEVKKAAATANMEMNMLPERIGHAIIQAACEVIKGKFFDHFIVDSIQGGAGTSINMNMNEVLANRSLELMGRSKGDYDYCSPNSIVNMSQSTNDTIPTALKIAAYRLTQDLLDGIELLRKSFEDKEKEFDDVLKMGRTHLQDAVPIRLGQEFGSYARLVGRDLQRISQASESLLIINMGATAVGTGLNAEEAYAQKVTKYLSEQLRMGLKVAEDLVDATQNTDVYTSLSSTIKVLAVNLSKICNDIRLMASGPFTGFNEINLPERQPGSSIMPGKVNPVMAEVVNQAAFQVIGNDHTINLASEAGQFELNVMEPIIIFNLLQSLKTINNSIRVFERFAVDGITANSIQCKKYAAESLGVITALNPHLGYETASKLAKESLATGHSVKDLCLEQGYLTESEIEEILDPLEMTSPGIAGKNSLLVR